MVFQNCGSIWDQVNSSVLGEDFAIKLNEIISSVRKDYDFLQWGAKTGQTYFEHAVKGIFAITQIYKISQLHKSISIDKSSKILKILCLSYLVHDLNKIMTNQKKSWKWDKETLKEELERINSKDGVVNKYLPGWEDYLDDMITMIKAHSIVYCHRGGELLINENYNIPSDGIFYLKLDKHEIETGINIFRLVDNLDLVKHASQDTFIMIGNDENGSENKISLNHENFFKWMQVFISRVAGEQMEIRNVNVVKEASVFTNIIMNQVINVLSSYKIYPLRIFTNGAIFFGNVSVFDPFFNGNVINQEKLDRIYEEIGILFASRIDEYILKQEQNLFKYASDGIKISDLVFQQPNSENKIRKTMSYLAKTISPLSYDNKNDEERKNSSRFNAANKLNNFLDDKTASMPVVSIWKSGWNDDLMDDDELWKMARLSHTTFFAIVYVFKKWFKEIDQKELMYDFIKNFDILDNLENIYDKITDTKVYRYYFFHLIGSELKKKGNTVDSIVEPLINFLLEKIKDISIDEPFIDDTASFIRDSVQIFTAPTSSKSIVEIPLPDEKITCTVCGKKMKNLGSKKKNENTYKWKSQQILDGVPVEKFSNFLVAGMPSKGVRMVCHSCMWRHYLESILTTVKGKSVSTWYVTFYMRDGLPFDSIKSMQAIIESMRENEENDTSFRVIPDDYEMDIKLQKGYGFMLPSIPDETCGSLTFAWKMKKSTVKEEFLDIMKDVLSMALKTKMKSVVTEMRNDHEEMLNNRGDILFQEAPGTFRKLMGGKNHVSFEEARKILDIIVEIERISKSIIKDLKNTQITGVKILDALLDKGITHAIHTVEHLWDDDKKKKHSVRRGYYFEKIRDIHDSYLSLFNQG